jgi:hypothetical protein
MESKSDENGDDESGGSGSGNEVTAEWIVKAQLKICQPKKKAASFGSSDCGARRSSDSPCRVVYKWNSDEKSQERSTASRQNIKNSSQKVRKKARKERKFSMQFFSQHRRERLRS